MKTESKVDVQELFAQAREDMNSSLIEREEETCMVLCALLCREHPLLVGPPGTAKSMLVDSLLHWMSGAGKFSILINKFTTPDEVFGPIDIQEMLDHKRVVRFTKGKLPDCHVAFIDEIFKASTAILNTMLKILNERVYENPDPFKVPLLFCLAASNEWPNENNGGAELGALFDRFLFRKKVRPIQSAQGRKDLLWEEDLQPVFRNTITQRQIVIAQDEAMDVEFTDQSKEAMENIITTLNQEGIFPGDRRLRKSVNACRAYAYLNGSARVQPEHLEILAHTLWDDPQEQPDKVYKIVQMTANPIVHTINTQIMIAMDVVKNNPPGDAVPKLKSIFAELEKLGKHPKRNLAMKTVQGLIKEQFAKVIPNITEEEVEV